MKFEELTDEQWEFIKPYLVAKAKGMKVVYIRKYEVPFSQTL